MQEAAHHAKRDYHGHTTILDKHAVTVFRFRITVSSQTLTIWLQDTSSKKQWQTQALRREDYVTSINGIAHAEVADYAKQFHECLSIRSDEKRRFSSVTLSGVRTLQLHIPLRSWSFATTLVFEFHLQPVAVVADGSLPIGGSLTMLDALLLELEQSKKASQARIEAAVENLEHACHVEIDQRRRKLNAAVAVVMAGVAFCCLATLKATH